jgi:hypothetical protein
MPGVHTGPYGPFAVVTVPGARPAVPVNRVTRAKSPRREDQRIRGSGGEGRGSCAMRFRGVAVGGELAGVVEDHYAVAEQAPPLLRMGRHDTCRRMIVRVRHGAWRPVPAHVTFSFLGWLCY